MGLLLYSKCKSIFSTLVSTSGASDWQVCQDCNFKLQQSLYFKTIRRLIKNVSYSETFGVYQCSKGFLVIFLLFSLETTRAPATDELPCSSPKLLIADFSRPPSPQDVPQALIDEHLLLLLQSLGQPPSFRTIEEHHFTFDPKTLSLVLVVSAVDHHIGFSIANACLTLQFIPGSACQCLPSCLKCSQVM